MLHGTGGLGACKFPYRPKVKASLRLKHSSDTKLQALVYDIHPSTTAVFSYAIGFRKLSANEQFFVGAQTVVSLLQTTHILADVWFITEHVAYATQIKPKSFESRRNSLFFLLFFPFLFFLFFFFPFLHGVDASHVYGRAWALGRFILVPEPVDTCAEIKSASSVMSLNLAEFGGRCRKAMLGVCI